MQVFSEASAIDLAVFAPVSMRWQTNCFGSIPPRMPSCPGVCNKLYIGFASAV